MNFARTLGPPALALALAWPATAQETTAPTAGATTGATSITGGATAGPSPGVASGATSGATAALSPVTPPGASAATPAGSPSAGSLLTLDEAIEYALINQPDIATSRADVQSSQGQLRVNKSGLLPSVNVDVTTGRNQTQQTTLVPSSGGVETPTTTTSTTVVGRSTTNFSASQLLYDVGRTRNSIAASRAALRASQANLSSTQIAVRRNVTDLYFAVLDREAVVRANEETVRDRQEQLNAAQARLEAGTAARFDVLNAQSQLATSQQLLVAAQSDLDTQRNNLNLAIGRPAGSDVAVTEPPAAPAPDQTDAIAVALANRPEVTAAQAQVESATRSLSAARVGNAPSLSASGGVSGSDTKFPATTLRYSVGLDLTWNAFDGRRNQGLVEEARGNLAMAQANLQRATLNVTQQVANDLTNLRNAQALLTAGDVAVASATEARDVALGRYQAGVGTQLEIIDAENQLLNAQVNQINARYSLANFQRLLQYDLGRTTLTP